MNTGMTKGLVGFGADQQWALLWDKQPWQKSGPQSNSESNYGTLTKGVVGFGAGQNWAILYDKNPATGYTPQQIQGITESGFLSKGVVGAGAGQDWALLYDKSGVLPPASDQSGFSIKVNPFRRAFCRKYVKSLGYLRREKIGGDKVGYIQAINECLVNFNKIRRGQYKMKPADTMGESTNLDSILLEAERETGVSKNDPALDKMGPPTQDDVNAISRTSGAKNLMLYIIIAIVVIAIIAMIMYMRRRNAAG